MFEFFMVIILSALVYLSIKIKISFNFLREIVGKLFIFGNISLKNKHYLKGVNKKNTKP